MLSKELLDRLSLVKIFGGPRHCCYSRLPQTRDLTTLCYILIFAFQYRIGQNPSVCSRSAKNSGRIE